MSAYYNEFKPEAAQMLRQLIKDGLIADGDVDERSILEVKADDLKGYTQCHFFAGIGGWSVALRMAAWSDDRAVWTGSCPCQPFSTAGKQKGKADERHLWPVWFRLIRECKPAIVFGEQVASAITHGWWDDVAADLEREGYAVGSAVLPACSVGKPHQRNRLWFVGDTRLQRQEIGKQQAAGIEQSGKSLALGDTNLHGCQPSALRGNDEQAFSGCAEGENEHQQSARTSPPEYVADTASERLEGGAGTLQEEWNDGFTSSLQWIECPDGKARPVEPGLRLLANGVQHRTPILHAFGNAIVPEVASAFIQSCTN